MLMQESQFDRSFKSVSGRAGTPTASPRRPKKLESINLKSLKDEIDRFSEEKRRKIEAEDGFDKDPESYKQNLKEELDREINERVREALDTPPLERVKKNKEKAKERRMEQIEKMNAQQRLLEEQVMLDLTDKEAAFLKARQWKELQKKRMRKQMSDNSFERKFILSFKEELSKSNQDQYPGVFGLERNSEGVKTYGRLAKFDNIAILTPQEKQRLYSIFTKEGFHEALTCGKFKDGSDLKQLPNGKYQDRYGIIRDEHGPFWPPDYGPMFPAPKHEQLPIQEEELLWMDIPAPSKTLETQDPGYTGRWRGIQIVFDAEKTSRDREMFRVPEGCCPSLTFESRFECGNLRQARRVGQYEYELILKTDLYTKRHTQWFYFQVKYMVPGVVYKIRIANLLKRDSLYNHGMRPLLYSEKEAKEKKIGWFRAGHNIVYQKNEKHMQCPLLHRELVYYELEFEIEFPHADDVCYLAHCYPYTFTDLKNDLDDLMADPQRLQVMKREVLCETKAGNSCFLLTVTNFESNNDSHKKAVIVTGRVHPGESNASWMMKGVIDFVTSSSYAAKELRDKFIFKIVPMLNPDGVIIGNYRCSLQARDLNRNYRHPRKESFPTVFATKQMMADIAVKHNILIYCDLHGHSRKSNVFMYGCSSPNNALDAKAVLEERLFPWLMANKAPEQFSFDGCKFQIRRCKEATGRVVMYRQYDIANSFTMEATFSGTKICSGGPRHFNQQDYQEMGRVFCEVVLEHTNLQQDKSRQSEVVLDLTRQITTQILEKRGLLNLDLANTDENDNTDTLQEDSQMSGVQKLTSAILALVKKEEGDSETDQSKISPQKKSNKKPVSPSDINLQSNEEGKAGISKMNVNQLIENMSLETIDGCVKLLETLQVDQMLQESSSSDSDSESDPEMTAPKEHHHKKKKKRKSKKHKEKDYHQKIREKAKSVDVIERPKSAILPAIMSADGEKKKKQGASSLSLPQPRTTALLIEPFDTQHSKNKLPNTPLGKCVRVQKPQPLYVNKYEGRSNGGIPCFAQERSLERAAKRMSEMRQRVEMENKRREAYYFSDEANYRRYMHLAHSMQQQREQTQEEILQSFQSAMLDDSPSAGHYGLLPRETSHTTPHRIVPIKTHYQHGDDVQLSPRLPFSPKPDLGESDSSEIDTDRSGLSLAALASPYGNSPQQLKSHLKPPEPPSDQQKFNNVFGKFAAGPVLKSKGVTIRHRPPPAPSEKGSRKGAVSADDHLNKVLAKVNEYDTQGNGVESLDDWAHITNYKNQRVKTPVPSRKERNYTDMLMGKMRHSKVMVASESGTRWPQERHSTCE